MAQNILNAIDPPPRLTGDPGRDTVAIIQWLSAFYTKGILSGGLLQPQNMDPALISLGALVGSADMLAYYTAEDVFDLTGFTAFARTLLDDADAATARATLGAGTVTGVTGTAPIASSGGNAPAISIATFVASGATHARGAVPDPGAVAGTTKFLREDATWVAPPGIGDVVGPAGAVDGNVVLFNTATGKLIKDGGTLGSAAFTSSAAYDAAGAAAAAQAASQPADADLTTWAGVTPGTGVATALAVNVGTAGAVIVNGGALGTPSSGTLTNATGLPAAGVTGTALVAAAIGTTVQAHSATLDTLAAITPLGTGVATALGGNVGSAGAFVTNGGALGTPSSGVGTNITGVNAATLGGATFASPGAIGGTTQSAISGTTGTFTGATGTVAANSYTGASRASVVGFSRVHNIEGTAAALQLYETTTGSSWEVANDDTGLFRIRTGGGADQLNITTTGAGTFSGTIRPKGYTVGTLPAGTIGMKAYVTDALAPAYLVLLAAGGAAYSGAQYSGTQWVGD